jgi:hypothetical protein
MAIGSLVLGVSGGTCLWRGAAGDPDHGSGGGIGKGGGTDEKLPDLANVQQKETREDRDNADERGRRSPVRRLENLDCGVTRGQ